MKEYKETPKEMAAKIRQSFSEYCRDLLNDNSVFTKEIAEKECALIYIKGIIENAYIKAVKYQNDGTLLTLKCHQRDYQRYRQYIYNENNTCLKTKP